MEFFRKKMGERGFNLFSALVAAALIMTSVVLINTMITTEEKTSSQVYQMQSAYQLNDAAAIARSDALQSFNQNFRESMQDYLTSSDSELENGGWPIVNTENFYDSKWNDIVKNFEKVILLSDSSGGGFDSAIDFVADRVVLKFAEVSYGRYTVLLSDKGPDAKNAVKDAVRAGLQGGDFLEIVDCNPNSSRGCPVGSFYFTIKLDEISNDTFEAMPKIIVKDLITKAEVKLPILPRTRLRIYIPLRFFKAIYHARENAEALANTENDLKKAKLGYCESGCTPRTDADSQETGNWEGHECGSVQTLGGGTTMYTGISTYKTSGGTAANNPLDGYSRKLICDNANTIGNTGSTDFLNYNSDSYPGGIMGLPGKPDNGIVKIDHCPFYSIDTKVKAAKTKVEQGTSENKFLYCGKVQQIIANVVFEERNPQYIVKGDTIKYKLEINSKIFSEPGEESQICKNLAGPTPRCTT